MSSVLSFTSFLVTIPSDKPSSEVRTPSAPESKPAAPSSTEPAASPSTTDSATSSSGPTLQDMMKKTAAVAESNWEVLILFGLERVDDNRVRVHRMFLGESEAIELGAQATMGIVKRILEAKKFEAETDHDGTTKH